LKIEEFEDKNQLMKTETIARKEKTIKKIGPVTK